MHFTTVLALSLRPPIRAARAGAQNVCISWCRTFGADYAARIPTLSGEQFRPRRWSRRVPSLGQNTLPAPTHTKRAWELDWELAKASVNGPLSTAGHVYWRFIIWSPFGHSSHTSIVVGCRYNRAQIAEVNRIPFWHQLAYRTSGYKGRTHYCRGRIR